MEGKARNSGPIRSRVLTLCIVVVVQGCAGSERPASGTPGSKCPPTPRHTDAERRLTLERTACLGDCPVYRLVIHSNGRVDWWGARFVAIEGAALSCVPPERVATLWETVDRWRGVTDSDASLETCVTVEHTAQGRVHHFGETDQPTLRITAQDTKTSTWVHHFGCSHSETRELLEIESQVRELVDLDGWVYGAAP